MYTEVLYITVAVCVSAVVLGGLMYVVLVGGCWLANRKNKREVREMTKFKTGDTIVKTVLRGMIITGLIYLYAQLSRYDTGVIDRLTVAGLLPGIVLMCAGRAGVYLIDVWRESKRGSNSKKGGAYHDRT